VGEKWNGFAVRPYRMRAADNKLALFRTRHRAMRWTFGLPFILNWESGK
jgi:hypothetical protein